MVELHDLAPAARAMSDLDAPCWKPEPLMQKTDQGGIGLVIDGRRGNPDLERIAVPPGHRGDARVGLDMEGEGEPALRRIETVPTHCSCRLDCL